MVLMLGAAFATVAAHLGGHLVFRLGVGDVIKGWTQVWTLRAARRMYGRILPFG